MNNVKSVDFQSTHQEPRPPGIFWYQSRARSAEPKEETAQLEKKLPLPALFWAGKRCHKKVQR